MRYYAVILMTALMLGAVPGGPAVAQAVSVIVDGRVVAFDQPPAVIAGRLLVPLRGVFERLGARVVWQPGFGRVVAQRSDTQVVLQPGSRQAFVNGQSVLLDSAPLVLAGRVLVPLRFISESLGAAVDWDPAARTVYVNSGPTALRPAPVPAPQPVQPQPLPPFQPAPPPPAPVPAPEPIRPPIRPEPQPQTILEGTVLGVEAQATPPRLHIRSNDGVLSTIVVRSDTAIFLTEATSGRGGAAGLDQIRRGDVVRIRLNSSLQAVAIRATYRELTGRVDRMSGRQIVLTDGQVFRLAEDAVVSVDGREVTRDNLRRGMEMVLRLHPQTGEVWEVRARALAALPTAPPVGPVLRIDTAAFNATAPLGAGGVLVVRAQGTPGSEAFFDIAGMQSGLRMVEGPPGHFTGQYAVRPGQTVNQSAVTVRLRAGGVEVSRNAGTVTLDGLAPQFARVQPAHDAVLRVSQPTIAAWFNERGPSGIDVNSARLWVNGTEITRVERLATYLSYTPPTPLPNGRIQVVARVGDRAGNIATTSWSFVVDVPATSAAPSPAPAAVTPGPRATPAAAPSPRPAQVAAPVITAPAQGEPIVAALVIRGTGPAGHRVEVTVELQFAGNKSPKVLGPFTANVGSNGAWEVQVQLPPADHQSARQATVTAVVIAPTGARSEPARIQLRRPARDPEGPGG